jgi:hypothetical protein
MDKRACGGEVMSRLGLTEKDLNEFIYENKGNAVQTLPEKSNWYFTFMQKQEHKNRYVKIHGTFFEAREKMVKAFGDQWCFQYSEEEFIPQIEMFGLRELEIREEE